MKVGIDISSLHSLSKGRGIGFYAQALIDSLKKHTDIEVKIIESVDQQQNVDLIHYPFFDFFRPTLKINRNIPTVVTIHDVIPLLFPKNYPPGIRGRVNLFLQKQSLNKVKAIITDSKSSTADVIKTLKIPQNKVHTVYLASSEHFKKLTDKEVNERTNKFNLPEIFALYSGGVNWNKNLINQTEAALKSDIDLVLVGGGFANKNNLEHPEMKEFKQFLDKYQNNPKIHILGFVSDDELVGLINRAKALLFASQYEGFGLPILESQACGTPVITGNISSMPEVAGSGAVLVDPNSVDQISLRLKNIINNQADRNQLIKKGFENLENFSWKKTAAETLKVYQNALG